MESGAGFGYKIEWLAVREQSAESVAAVLGLGRPVAATWPDAVATAYAGRWMLTPPIDGRTLPASAAVEPLVGDRTFPASPAVEPPVGGWTLAASTAVGAPEGSRFEGWLARLSAALGEVQYFGTHRVVEDQAYARASGGVVDRAFGYLGERDDVLFQVGEETPEERSLGVGFVPDDDWWAAWEETEDDDKWPWPDEETVLTIARHWSVDPRSLAGARLSAMPWIAGAPAS